MTTTPTPPAPCDAFSHKWQEVYYGFKCSVCGSFVPDNFFSDFDGHDDDESTAGHSLECTCETCLQDHPEREYLIGDDYD